MAEALGYLLEKIDYILNKEWDLLRGIDNEVYGLRREFETIRAILKEGDTRWGNDNPFLGIWMNQVRDSANDIEDVLDTFTFYQAHHFRRSGKRATTLTRRHSVATSIQEIKGKLEAAKQNREKYHLISASAASTSAQNHTTYLHNSRVIGSLYLDNADIVGIEEPRKKLVAWATEGDPKLEVMFVVGMGGLGKTTLVKKVYENVKLRFDHHAWISVSQCGTTQELLMSMSKLFSNPEEDKILRRLYSTSNIIQLTDKLCDMLQNKSYLVVFDDLGSQDVWESVKWAFPTRRCHGRIIITTRRGDIANYCKRESVSVYNLQPLPPKKARDLFYMKAFPETSECPSGLLHWCDKILGVCNGLPLAIVAIGDLLSNTERSADAWRTLHDSLGSELQNNGRLSRLMKILSLSFDDLPYYLKYCVLYMSVFPENYSIGRRRLIRLWISEGLVIEAKGKTLEEVGEDYVKELILTNVVKADGIEFDGRARACQVHCLLHKILLLKSEEENFCTVSTESELNFNRKIRRLSIHKSCNNISQQKLAYARTFFMFGCAENSISAGLTNILSKFQILKVLDLTDVLLNNFPVAITELLLLRYLSLRNTNIRKLPKSLGKLQNLEFLDLKENFISELSNKILKFTKLRHLLLYHSNKNIYSYSAIDSIQGFKTTAKIGSLVSLQKLSFVKANKNHGMIKALGNLTQLRKLGITELEEQDGKYLCHSIERMSNLRSLDLTSNKDDFLDLNAIATPPCHLKHLYLKGRLKKLPSWISSLHDLVKISLKWSKLKTNAIYSLQHLPNLIELQLVDAFTGSELVLLRNKFKNLKVLELESLEALETVIMANGALPSLQKLIIKGCKRLKMVPEWTHELTQLQEFHLHDMPEEFVNGLQKNGGKYRHLVQHIPLIRAYFHSSSGCWRTRDLS